MKTPAQVAGDRVFGRSISEPENHKLKPQSTLLLRGRARHQAGEAPPRTPPALPDVVPLGTVDVDGLAPVVAGSSPELTVEGGTGRTELGKLPVVVGPGEPAVGGYESVQGGGTAWLGGLELHAVLAKFT